jgi:hypothetical protein
VKIYQNAFAKIVSANVFVQKMIMANAHANAKIVAKITVVVIK